ncbi:MAG: hypothetical protein H6657_20920 [Ardenticatenaceae bacterium]|nr:hypothetical protein [Ardenticatenaceae bacterium]
MNRHYLNCYALGRYAPAQEQLDYVLPCNREQALQLFALHMNVKTLLIPRKHLVSRRVPTKQLYVSRVSSYGMATFLWRSGYMGRTTNPVMRFMDKMGYHLQMFRHLHRDEQAIDEVVLELFYSTQGQTPCIDLPDPEVYPEDLLLARLHFAQIAPGQTLLRLFLGWTDTASLEGLRELYDVLVRYMDLLHRVLPPNDPPIAPVEGEPSVIAEHEAGAQRERPLPELIAVAAEALTIDTMAEAVVPHGALTEDAETEIREIDPAGVDCGCAEANRVPDDHALTPTAEAVAGEPAPAWQVQAAEGKDRLHQDNSFGPVAEPEVTVDEATAGDIADPEDPVGQHLLAVPVPTEDELQLYRKMKPPRMYASTLSNICVMVTERQRQIDAGGEIPKLDTFNRRVRPSRNTMLKIPELFTHWFDKQYRWNLITWLRDHSGHTKTEVSEILSTLYYSLSPEAWAAVTSAGREAETNRSRRHHARKEDENSRPGGQLGTVH